MRFSWRSQISVKHLAVYLGFFFAIRATSFLFADAHIVQALIVAFLCTALASLYYIDRDTAIFLLVAELLLGGNGQYIELFGLSLRSALFITFLIVWVLHLISSRTHRSEIYMPHRLLYILLPAAIGIIIGVIRGIVLGNGVVPVLQDALPFAYFLIIPPFYHMIVRKQFQKELAALIVSFILGTLVWEILLFILFATGMSAIHDPFYSWLRDAGAQKITDMGNGFFRIVSPSHLLVPLIITIIYSLKLHAKKRALWYLIIPLLIILLLDLSRAYILCTIVGYFFLFRKSYAKDWLLVGLISCGIGITLFLLLNLSASAGRSTGIELLTNRISSFSTPSIEESTYTRMAILPYAWEAITEHPLFGHGLGTAITFPNPLSGIQITTRQIDWGILELWIELGLFGLVSMLLLVSAIVYALYQHIRFAHHNRSVDRGIIAALLTLCVLTIFGPGLFHVYGVLFLAICISMTLPAPLVRYEMLVWIHQKMHILPE